MSAPPHVRMLALLLRLYPPAVRRRFEPQILASAREAAAAGRGRPVAVLLDAVVTLVRAWAAVVTRPLAALGPRAFASLARDGAIALRGARRRPLQVTVVVATLGVALGANAAIYTVTHALLLETLPYDAPERVMSVDPPPTRMATHANGLYFLVDHALADHPGVEAAATYYAQGAANLIEGSDASRVRVTQVSDAFFQTLGAPMRLGAGIVPGSEAEDEAVLSYRLWRTAFGGAPEILGQRLVLNGRSFRVVGVAAEGVEYPSGTEVWLSDPPIGEFYGGALGPSVVARLRPGARDAVVDAMAAYAEVEREEAGPEYADRIREPQLVPLRDELSRDVRLPLLVLSAAAGALLLLGCVNVAGVSLALLSGRRSELAMRRALGAGAGRIFAQLMAELGAVAVLAGALSVALAMLMVPVLVALLPSGTPRLQEVSPGVAMLAFVAAATAFAALVAGVPTALGAARGGGGAHPDRIRPDDPRTQRFQGLLTAVQVALAVVLVASASLLGRSLAELRAVPLGYDTEGVLTFQVRLPLAVYPDVASLDAYAETVRDRLAALPGVSAAGVTSDLPLGEAMGVGARVRVMGAPEDTETAVRLVSVDDQYFSAMGIPLLEGRAFRSGDADAAAVVLSRTAARALFGETPAVGRRVGVRGVRTPPEVLVVGVVGDVRLAGAEQEVGPTLYNRLEGSGIGWPGFAIRTEGPPAALAPMVRSTLAEIDPGVPPFDLRTTREAVAELMAARRAVSMLADLFGAAALLLAALAIYGLLAQVVTRRRREMGIRLALGATARRLEREVVGRGLAWSALGVAVGLLLSVAATGLLQGMLYGVAPRDPRVLATAGIVVLATALAAAWLPARRAARIDPVASLRAE